MGNAAIGIASCCSQFLQAFIFAPILRVWDDLEEESFRGKVKQRKKSVLMAKIQSSKSCLKFQSNLTCILL